MSNIGRKIRALREEKNWSQRELAKRIDMNFSVLNRVELGERPIRDDEIIKLSDIFNVSADYLLGRVKSHAYIQETTSIYASNHSAITKHDISKKLEEILHDLDSDTNLSFNGESLDDATRIFVKILIESNLIATERLVKKMNLKKSKKDDSFEES